MEQGVSKEEVRKELGRRSAIWVLFCNTCIVVWIVAAVVSFS